ncbi:MAG TPA: LysM peptidoglycan-binding domain-containing protein [Acidimicrobiia bacterium]
MPRFRRSRALLVGLALVLTVALFSVDYTVQHGDTLGGIAREHDVSLSDLIQANNISNPNLIYPGQKLTIPGSEEVYTVVFGDTLGRIAKRYKTSVSQLTSANNIPNPNIILVGQQILIPTGSSGSGSGPTGGSSNEGTISDRTGKVHVVKRGETLARIAAQYRGVTADDIAAANGILNGIIYAGQGLYLSGPGYVASGAAGEAKYRVERGDRLGDIAHSHGVAVNSLVSLNKISNPNLIRSGQVLRIPTGSEWVCPVEGASFMNDWGFPRGGGVRYHEGNDLFVSRGTPVRAPVSGTVKQKTGTIGGLQFTLDGSDGVRYIGTHMDQFGKKGKVKAGEIIGYVGNTGNAVGTSPHLHFGMYYQGTPVNPYPSLIAHGCD